MFIKHSIVKPWVICEPGDPIQVISARDKNAIIISCNGERLTVSQYDITDVKPIETKNTIPEPAKVEIKQVKLAIIKQVPAKVEVKPQTSQKSFF